jgi:hypothetical protein
MMAIGHSYGLLSVIDAWLMNATILPNGVVVVPNPPPNLDNVIAN